MSYSESFYQISPLYYVLAPIQVIKRITQHNRIDNTSSHIKIQHCRYTIKQYDVYNKISSRVQPSLRKNNLMQISSTLQLDYAFHKPSISSDTNWFSIVCMLLFVLALTLFAYLPAFFLFSNDRI